MIRKLLGIRHSALKYLHRGMMGQKLRIAEFFVAIWKERGPMCKSVGEEIAFIVENIGLS